MQPGRMIVLDFPRGGPAVALLPLGFTRPKSGRLKGRFTRTFSPGVFGWVKWMEVKEQMEDLPLQFHTEFVGKVYPQCTMYCSTPHHPGHTEQCVQRRKGK